MYDYPIVVKVHSCLGIDYFLIFYSKPGSMDAEEMRRRTKSFAINVAKYTGKIPDTQVDRIYKGQIIRTSSSVGVITGLQDLLNRNLIFSIN